MSCKFEALCVDFISYYCNSGHRLQAGIALPAASKEHLENYLIVLLRIWTEIAGLWEKE